GEACRDAVLRKDGEAADAIAKRLGRLLVETRFTILDGDGAVLGDSERDPKTVENQGSRPEVAAARATGLGEASRRQGPDAETFYVAVRLDEKKPEAGFVRAALPESALDRRFRSQLAQIAFSGAPVGIIAFVALALSLLALVSALTEVTRVARRVARGGGI